MEELTPVDHATEEPSAETSRYNELSLWYPNAVELLNIDPFYSEAKDTKQYGPGGLIGVLYIDDMQADPTINIIFGQLERLAINYFSANGSGAEERKDIIKDLMSIYDGTPFGNPTDLVLAHRATNFVTGETRDAYQCVDLGTLVRGALLRTGYGDLAKTMIRSIEFEELPPAELHGAEEQALLQKTG